MKFLLITFCSISSLFMGYTHFKKDPVGIDKVALGEVLQKKQFSIISCTPDWTNYHLSEEEIKQMIPLPGTGSHSWKISTSKDSAQFYFNQGMNLYYGFHIIEALPSFKKAQRFDPDCAILYWAEALAYGPNINDLGYSASPDALIATKRSNDLINKASEKEKALINAMQVRYSGDTSQKREDLNQWYADKMKSLYALYPSDTEIGTLYADALMIQHPWDLWQHNGEPKPWTPLIENILENVLSYSPDHPGANHYYIHTMEASPFASKATASADRLGSLAPGLSHIVHMPSHIYIRTGQYEKGVLVNKAAVKGYNRYLKLYPDVANNVFLYEVHNRQMQAANSINLNNYALAINDALEARNCFDTSFMSMEAPMGTFAQYVYMTPEFTMITFEKWQEIIRQPRIKSKFHYALLLQQFAKGLAYANTNQLQNARACLSKLESLLREKDLHVVLPPFNAPITGATVALYILKGMIAEKENNLSGAISNYKIAVTTEDSLIYNEPRDWLVPARHYLGNTLIKAKRFKEAENVFVEDLKVQPENAISKKGLRMAENMQNK